MKPIAAFALLVACGPELAREGDRELCHRWVAVALERLTTCGADPASLEAWLASRSARCERLVFVNPLATSPEECTRAIAAIPCDVVRTSRPAIPWCEAFVTGEEP